MEGRGSVLPEQESLTKASPCLCLEPVRPWEASWLRARHGLQSHALRSPEIELKKGLLTDSWAPCTGS